MNNVGAYQSFVLYSMYLIESIATIGGVSEAGRDAYISFALGGILSALLYKFYFYVLYRKKCEKGKVKKTAFTAIMALFTVFSIHIAAIAQSVLTLFLSHMTLVDTPDILICGFISIVVLAISVKEITVLSRTCEILFPIVIGLVAFSIICAVSQGHISNLFPILKNGVGPLANGLLTSLLFPFCDGFFCIFLICQSSREADAKKGILFATAFCTFILTIVFIKNLAVLGYPFIGSLYFPSYTVASLITLSTFFQRLEVFVSIIFMLCMIVKICVLTIFAKRTFAKMSGKNISAVPAVFLVFNLSSILFSGIVEAFAWLQVYRYYLIIPTILLPISLLAVSKKR